MSAARVAIITGGSSGIGKETARELARQGRHVVIVSRPGKLLEASVTEIQSSAPNASVSALAADLSRVADVRRLAGEIGARFSTVELLVNNAGMVPVTREMTPEGHEVAFATNCLAPFLLTELLLPHLRASAPARVVNIFGDGTAKIDFSNLESERAPFDGWDTYVRSKTGVLMVTQEFARRIPADEVTFNAALPGLVNTAQMSNMRGAMRLLIFLMRPFLLTPREGSRTPLWVATAPELRRISGKAFGRAFGNGRREFALKPHIRDPEQCSRFYEICERLTSAERAVGIGTSGTGP